MDADQKLTELKKAYADMILNTAKEAAARVMVSERKALRLELELKQSKENALQMLMRLKHMMDLKINESEMASRTQQKRIEEVEAQLQEAEEIVKDLREELNELKNVTPKKLTVQVNDALDKNISEEQLNVMKSCTDDQDLPAIILRNKGTKRYRSGCTQRIHACEQKDNTTHESDEKLHKCPSFGYKKKNSNEGINDVKYLVNVADVYNRLRQTDLESVSFIHRTKEEILPLGCEKTQSPLRSEAQVDHPESNLLLTGGTPTQPTGSKVIKYTFQRKKKRGTLTTKKEDDKIAVLLTENVNLIQESTQEETEKVNSVEESIQEENLELVAQQLISLSEKKW